MEVNEKTKYFDFITFENCITDESKAELQKAAEKAIKPYYELTLEELFLCLKGDFSIAGYIKGNEADLTALGGVWIKGFAVWVDGLIDKLKALQVEPANIEAKQAAAKCLKSTFEESTLVFCREYFNLHSFADVYELKVSDLLIAKKDAYNKAMFERTYASLQTKKYKK